MSAKRWLPIKSSSPLPPINCTPPSEAIISTASCTQFTESVIYFSSFSVLLNEKIISAKSAVLVTKLSGITLPPLNNFHHARALFVQGKLAHHAVIIQEY